MVNRNDGGRQDRARAFEEPRATAVPVTVAVPTVVVQTIIMQTAWSCVLRGSHLVCVLHVFGSIVGYNFQL